MSVGFFLDQSSNSRATGGNPFVNYLRSLKWVPIPLGVGFAYIGYQQLGHVVKREEQRVSQSRDPEELVANDWMVSFPEGGDLMKGLNHSCLVTPYGDRDLGQHWLR